MSDDDQCSDDEYEDMYFDDGPYAEAVRLSKSPIIVRLQSNEF